MLRELGHGEQGRQTDPLDLAGPRRARTAASGAAAAPPGSAACSPLPCLPPTPCTYTLPRFPDRARGTPQAQGSPYQPQTPWQTQATPSPSPHAPTRPLPLQSELWTHAGASPHRAPRASPHPMGRRRPANTSCLALPGSCLRSTSPNPEPLTEQQQCPKWSLWGAGMGTAHLPTAGARAASGTAPGGAPSKGRTENHSAEAGPSSLENLGSQQQPPCPLPALCKAPSPYSQGRTGGTGTWHAAIWGARPY